MVPWTAHAVLDRSFVDAGVRKALDRPPDARRMGSESALLGWLRGGRQRGEERRSLPNRTNTYEAPDRGGISMPANGGVL